MLEVLSNSVLNNANLIKLLQENLVVTQTEFTVKLDNLKREVMGEATEEDPGDTTEHDYNETAHFKQERE